MGTLSRLTILVSFLSVLFIADAANADRRILAGATISLAPAKLNKLDDILGICLREETLASLYPALATVGPAPGTSAEVHNDHRYQEDRIGDDLKWTSKSTWLPATEYRMTFLEWANVSTSIEREFDLKVVASSYDTSFEETDLDANFSTDAGGKLVDVNLRLTGALPYIDVKSYGAMVCSVNNWGSEDCVESETTSAVDLVIPTNFANSGIWMNLETNRMTQKSFNYFKYAECLLWHWEN